MKPVARQLMIGSCIAQDPEIDAKFGFLYSGYRLYYWESLEMIRKLLLAGIPVFIAVQPTGSSQAVLGEVVLVGYLFATTYFKPFVKALDNLLAMFSLLGAAVLCPDLPESCIAAQ